VQIEGTWQRNGTGIGLAVAISDSPAGGVPRAGYVLWSHHDDAHPAPGQGHAVDWDTVRLSGWNGRTPFAFSDRPLRNTIRWIRSQLFVKGVWAPGTRVRLDAVLERAERTVGSTDRRAAPAGLRRPDTRYPDPVDLPSRTTLPDPWRYLDGTGVTGVVDRFGEGGRREQLLDLARFYEYGYKSPDPDGTPPTGSAPVPAGWGTPAGCSITTSVTCGSVTAPLAFRLQPPTDAARRSSGRSGPVPVVVSFGGYLPEHGGAGYAVLTVPANVTTDDRNDPWGRRTGVFRTFFPCSRDGDVHEIGNEMVAGLEASRAIDALELAVAAGTRSGPDLGSPVTPDDLAVTGHSINGKHAFVSAVLDERIDVCVPSAAGATGPSPYRCVCTGHEYSWGTATGTETLGDTVRHDPGRTMERLRRFLTSGRSYQRRPGALGIRGPAALRPARAGGHPGTTGHRSAQQGPPVPAVPVTRHDRPSPQPRPSTASARVPRPSCRRSGGHSCRCATRSLRTDASRAWARKSAESRPRARAIRSVRAAWRSW